MVRRPILHSIAGDGERGIQGGKIVTEQPPGGGKAGNGHDLGRSLNVANPYVLQRRHCHLPMYRLGPLTRMEICSVRTSVVSLSQGNNRGKPS